MLAPGSPVHVRKLRPDGSEAYSWDGSVLRRTQSTVTTCER